MVNGIGFTGGYSNLGQYSQDFENVAKYALGTTIVNGEDSPFAGMGLMLGLGALPELWKGGKWLFSEKARNGQTVSEGWTKGVKQFQDEYKTFGKNVKDAGIKGVWNNYSAKTVLNAIPNEEKFAKLSVDAQRNYSRAKNLAEFAKNNPEKARKAINIADKALTKANALAYAEKINKPAEGTWGKISRFFGKYTGYNKANLAIKEFAATKSPVTSKILKYSKGHGVGLFLAIEGAMALFTIIPTFSQLGAGSGVKQIGKSVVKSGASIGGWVAGATAGAAIGSIIPGAGTIVGGAIGALCGLVGGCIGSWAARKGAEKIVGKDELELAKEKQAKELAQQAAQSPEAAQQLLAAAGQRLEAEGTESEDAKIAFGSLTKLAAQTQVTAPQTQYAQNPTSFTGDPTQQTTANPFRFNPNKYSQTDFREQDFMAMGAGLV